MNSRKTRVASAIALFASLPVIYSSQSATSEEYLRESTSSPLSTKRLPPQLPCSYNDLPLVTSDGDSTACHAGAICVGPGHTYPLGRKPNTVIKSRFVVPSLPKQHDSATTTYYDYLNIFWRAQPVGGYMNQFVPQLMLGNALSNSSNYPDYAPHWIEMDKWHIGAQYFMGVCVRNASFPDGFECDPQTWVPKAATGRLVSVEPGEVVETSFELVEKPPEEREDIQQVKNSPTSTTSIPGTYEWHLRIGVVGGGPDRTSVVVSKRPFMGLVESTRSWHEEIYDSVYIGSCLENYGMDSADNYPPEWQIDVKMSSPVAGSWWRDWRLEGENGCPWQPNTQVDNIAGEAWQRAVWRAFL